MLVLKDDYKPTLSMRDTQKAIKIVRDTFEDNLAERLNLERISAPLFVTRKSGINDDLNGVERAVSFDVKEMPEGQTEIFYASGESYDKIAKLPQIEKAKDKGYEILFFKDGVDEFIAKILIEYDGKKFKSVSEADFSLSDEVEKQQLEEKSKEYKVGLMQLERQIFKFAFHVYSKRDWYKCILFVCHNWDKLSNMPFTKIEPNPLSVVQNLYYDFWAEFNQKASEHVEYISEFTVHHFPSVRCYEDLCFGHFFHICVTICFSLS